jgi:hypothetical protein
MSHIPSMRTKHCLRRGNGCTKPCGGMTPGTGPRLRPCLVFDGCEDAGSAGTARDAIGAGTMSRPGWVSERCAVPGGRRTAGRVAALSGEVRALRVAVVRQRPGTAGGTLGEVGRRPVHERSCDLGRREQGGRHGGGDPCASDDLLANRQPILKTLTPSVARLEASTVRSPDPSASWPLQGHWHRRAVADSARPALPMCRWAGHLLA